MICASCVKFLLRLGVFIVATAGKKQTGYLVAFAGYCNGPGNPSIPIRFYYRIRELIF
jgi:hypothetical protein